MARSKSNSRSRTFTITAAVITSLGGAPIGLISAQGAETMIDTARRENLARDSIRLAKREAWLISQGRSDAARKIRALYTPEFLAKHYRRYVTGNDVDRAAIERDADFRAQDVAAMYTVADIAALESRGINLLTHVRGVGSLAGIVATSDLIGIIEVTAVDTMAEAPDGRHSTVTGKLLKVLKGSAHTENIRIRELTGKSNSGVVIDAPNEIVADSGMRIVSPTLGTQFLVFLSKSGYQLAVLKDDKVPMDDGHTYYKHVGPVYQVTQDAQLKPWRSPHWKTSINEIETLAAPYR